MNKCPFPSNISGRIPHPHVPLAYMPPYRINGYRPLPEPPKPPIIPEDLRRSIALRRSSELPEPIYEDPQGEQLLTNEVIQSLTKDLHAILREHFNKNKAKRSDKQCGPGAECKGSSPPPGISKAFWKLKTEHFGRPPTGSKFQNSRFPTDPEVEKEVVEFPLYESASNYKIPQWRYQPERVPFKLSELEKRVEVRNWGTLINNNLGDIQRSREEWAQRPDHEGFVPQDRVNYGCERIRELAEINANIVFLLVKKFVTGAPHKDIHFLNRTEAVDCWERIVDEDSKIKTCCSEVPKKVRSKPFIPALRTPKKAGQNLLEESEAVAKKRPKKSKPKGPIIPPFCEAIPPPDKRLPWHIPPLRPLDGDDRRKKVVFDRTIDLEFIIKPSADPYGEERRKQRASRVKALRQAMTNDFFKRTEIGGEVGELDILLQNAQKNFDGTPKARRDLMLAQVLAKSNLENTADKAREMEAEAKRQERIAARNVAPDFSHVPSRYKEVGKFKSGGVSRIL